jgi:hypothetical protein
MLITQIALILSMALQLVAAVLAIRLTRVTNTTFPGFLLVQDFS